MPPKQEQRAIAGVLSNASAIVQDLSASLQNLRLQKRALMHQLLTGKRRVKVQEEAA